MSEMGKTVKGRRRILKSILAFLCVMLILTIFCWRFVELLTPRVFCLNPSSGSLERVLSADGTVKDGKVLFFIPLEQDDSYPLNASILVTAANLDSPLMLQVNEREYDAESDLLSCIALTGNAALFDGQPCKVTRSEFIGTYDALLPAQCVFQEGDVSYVCEVTKTESIWSPLVIRKVIVEVEADNGYLLAVSGGIDTSSLIVQYYTASLSDRMRVRLAESQT